MDAKRVGHKLVHIAAGDPTLRGSHYERLFGSDAAPGTYHAVVFASDRYGATTTRELRVTVPSSP